MPRCLRRLMKDKIERIDIMKISNTNFISLTEFSKKELEELLDFTEQMKCNKDKTKYLTEKMVGLLFSVASTRTRISFQRGVMQLGGHAEFFNATDLQLVNHESLVDTAAVMGRYLDALVVRMYDMDHYGQGRKNLNLLAEHANIPIINALDDKEHPCQVMGDIFTMKEKFGEDYKKKKIVMTWGYAKRQKSPGVLHSMLTVSALLGMNVTFAYPKGFELDDEYLEFANRAATTSGAKIEYCNDLREAAEGADVIYVKSWKSLKMSREKDKKVRNEIRDKWCVSQEHYELANPGAYFMNCLPIIRGEQATSEVIDGKQSIIYDEAENRLHIQKAIMAALLSK